VYAVSELGKTRDWIVRERNRRLGKATPPTADIRARDFSSFDIKVHFHEPLKPAISIINDKKNQN